MKKILFIIMMVAMPIGSYGQQHDTINLALCLRLASDRSPIQRQKIISGEVMDIKVKNLNVSWLPAIGIQAQANYNSETINFSDLMEGIPVSLPELPLDQYKIWTDINQPLFDGGVIRAQKTIERSVFEMELQQTDVALYSAKQMVLQVYFSILIADKSMEVIQLSRDELRERITVLDAGVDNGVVLPEDLMALQAEALRMDQMVDETEITRQTLLYNLSVLVDSVLSATTGIVVPDQPVNLAGEVNRPEYLLFDRQLASFDANKKLVASSDMPKIFAFSQVAYGRPGFNVVSDYFHDYYSVGLGMKWNILNYGKTRRQKKLLDLQKDLVMIQRESFDDKLNIQLQTEKNNMTKYEDLLLKDEEILTLRKNITRASYSRLANGTISATEYLSELNKEILARLQMEQHKLLKIQSAYNFLFLQGKL